MLLIFTVQGGDFSLLEKSITCVLFVFNDNLLSASQVLSFYDSLFIVFKRKFIS